MSSVNKILRKISDINVQLKNYNVELSVTDEIMGDIDTLTDMIYDFRGDISQQADQLYTNFFQPLLEQQEDLKQVLERGYEVQEKLKEIGFDIPLDFEAKINEAYHYAELNFKSYEDALEKLIYMESEVM